MSKYTQTGYIYTCCCNTRDMLITQNKVKAQYVNDLLLNELEEETVHDFRCARLFLVPGCTLYC